MSNVVQPSREPDILRRLEVLLVLLAAFGIALVLVDFPSPSNQTPDASWQVALVDAQVHHRQFGTELIFTFGPWGWLLSHFYPNAELGAKAAWEIGAKTLGTLTLCLSSLGWSRTRRWSYLLLLLLLGPLFADTFFLLLIATCVLAWLGPEGSPVGRSLLMAAILAFLAETKFTYAILGATGVVLAMLARLAAHDRRGAMGISGTFVAIFLLGWLVAGQSLSVLPAWLARSWEVSSGYPQAMNLDEKPAVFFAGLTVAILCAAQISYSFFRMKAWRESLPILAFVTIAVFLAWKHGFVRADGHTVGFFSFVGIFSVAWPAMLPATGRTRWFGIIPLCCLLGFWLADVTLFNYVGKNVRQRFGMNLQLLIHPTARQAGFLAGLQETSERLSLPAARAEIGLHTVDFINDQQGYLFANQLNYDPRPVPQSYSAYTPSLLARNAEFFRSGAAPDFVLLQYSTVDQRFPTQDDSVAIAEMPLRYSLVENREGCLVLRRKSGASPPPLRREPIISRPFRLGEEILLPEQRNRAIWIQADLPLSALGQLRSLFYKPPVMLLTAIDDKGGHTQHRVIPGIAQEGFVVQPFIEKQDDFAAFMKGRGNKWLRAVRFDPAPGQDRWWSQPTVRFFGLPALPMEPLSPYEFVVERGLANFTPERIGSTAGIELFPVENRLAMLVHAPGEIVIAPAGSPHSIRGRFGLREGSYSGAGRTDGVEFSVEVVDAAGTTTTLWRRLLDPLSEPRDRGSQAFSVDLPRAGAKHLILRTGVGPRGDGNWDWSYWSDLQLSP